MFRDQPGLHQYGRSAPSTSSQSFSAATPGPSLSRGQKILAVPIGNAVTRTGAVAGGGNIVLTSTGKTLHLVPTSSAPSTSGAPSPSFVSNILNHSSSRKRALEPAEGGPFSHPSPGPSGGAPARPTGAAFDSGSIVIRRSRSDKGNKGLRHFSMRVCEKVQKKGVTTYNEVADELVAELTNFSATGNVPITAAQQLDQKNIRRRVYDALNVLMAMGILAKERKEIRWIGLPTNTAEEVVKLQQEQEQRLARVRAKTQRLQELLMQQIYYKNLISRNKLEETSTGKKPAPSSFVSLPFLLMDTDKDTVIDCSISNNKAEYLFNFSAIFQLKDETGILRSLNMGKGIEDGNISEADLQHILASMPTAFHGDIIRMAQGQKDIPLPHPSLVTATEGAASGHYDGTSDYDDQESE
ncbi:unnamed protein product [Cyprideis torosa]|uniref:Uncharacterized protein n=1 Tax=Cyprideis torosa TaxID=163714 RepID=A0A7R8ZH89_9CRUS|nr:unnamed protein product [Cyprideis torosa]CAG0883111.1 unnamed protein product [Cyprideis torosa]